MRTLSALMIAALVAVPAFAQPPGGGRFGGMGMGGGGLMLLGNADVQKDLKITDEQKTKIKEFTDKQAAAMREAFGGGGERPDPEKMRELFTKSRDEGAKFMKEALTEEQNTRLKQITLQQALKNNPASAFFAVNFSREGTTYGDPTETGKALKVTDEQKEKIKAIADQLGKDRREVTGGGGGGGGRPMRPTADQQKKLEALSKEANEKIMEVFTEEQHKMLKELVGKPFEGNLQQGGPGGRRPGGPGGGRDGV